MYPNFWYYDGCYPFLNGFNCMIQILLSRKYICLYNVSDRSDCTPAQPIRSLFGCVLFLYWMSTFADKYHRWFYIRKGYVFPVLQLLTSLGCLRPWVFFLNIGLDVLSRTSFISHFSCDQPALWTVMFVRPCVCAWVRHIFFTVFLSSYHHEIF